MSEERSPQNPQKDKNIVLLDISKALDACLIVHGFTWEMPEVRERLGSKITEALPDLLKKVVTRSVILDAISEHSNAERARLKALGRVLKTVVKTSEAPPPASGEREDSSSSKDMPSAVPDAHAGQGKKSITP